MRWVLHVEAQREHRETALRRWKGHVSNLTGKQPSYYSQLSGACLDTLHWTGFKFLEP